MRVLIMRHGAAAPASFGPDAHRCLTAPGRRQSESAAQALRDAGWSPTHIYTSPLVRAVQTAERVASVIGYPGPIDVLPSLVPGGSAAEAFANLESHGGDDVVLLVSHEPTVRGLAGHLLGRAVGHFGTAEIRGVTLAAAATLDLTVGG